MRLREIQLVAAALTVVSFGCGTGNIIVEGVVQLEGGAPLGTGELIFDSGAYSEIALIDQNGRFKSLKPLPPGIYKVIIQGAVEGDYNRPVPLVDARYTTPETTDLSIVVETKRMDPVIFTVRPPSRK